MSKTISTLLAIAAFIFSVLAFYNSSKKSESVSEKRSSPFHQEEKEPQEEVEIADLMHGVQTFHLKAYMAAKANNETLTKFYLNELGEKMLDISKMNLWSNGVNISANMKVFGLKELDGLLALPVQEVFTNFDNLTNGCNGCHMASKHPEIKIKTPVDAVFYNQDFNP